MRHRFRALGVIALVGLALRLAVVALRPSCPTGQLGTGCFTGANDATYYHLQANLLAKGEGFSTFAPLEVWQSVGPTRPSAFHPPLYSAYLGLWSWLGADSVTAHRVVSALLGVVTVVLIGLLGRRVGGARCGLIAAGLAALYPNLWINDTMLMSEALYAPLVALFAVLAFRFWDRPGSIPALSCGLVIGLAALTRAEALLLGPLVMAPLVVGLRRLGPRRQLGLLGLAAAGAVLMVSPWVARNLTQFESPVLMTTGTGTFLHAGSCDETYYGRMIGSQLECASQDLPAHLDESESDAILRRAALDYVGEHAGRFPLVAAARVGRAYDLWRPSLQVESNWRFENRGHWSSAAGMLAHWLLLPFAVAGAVWLRRRQVPLSPLVGLVVMSVMVVALVFGLTRYRAASDVATVVLAAAGLEAWFRHLFGVPPEAETGADSGEQAAEGERVGQALEGDDVSGPAERHVEHLGPGPH